MNLNTYKLEQKINPELISLIPENFKLQEVTLNQFSNEKAIILYAKMLDKQSFLSKIDSKLIPPPNYINKAFIGNWIPKETQQRFYESKDGDIFLTDDEVYELGSLKKNLSDHGFIIIGKNYFIAVVYNL